MPKLTTYRKTETFILLLSSSFFMTSTAPPPNTSTVDGYIIREIRPQYCKN